MRYIDNTHIAIRLPDLRAAEQYYAELFDLDVAWRDTRGDASVFAGWEQLDAAGLQPWIAALYSGNFRLTIEQGEGAPPRSGLGLDHVGLNVSQDQLGRIRDRVSSMGLEVKLSTERLFQFHDRFGLFWELDTQSHADIVRLGRELDEMHRQRRVGGGA